jgi:hypothetical protein
MALFLNNSYRRLKIILFLCLAGITNLFSQGTEFHLTFTKEISDEPLTGRAVLFLSKDTLVDPDITNPYQLFITFGKNFTNWKNEEELILTNSNSDSFLSTMNGLNGYYSLRAVIDIDSTSCLFYNNGNLYSDKIIFSSASGKLNIVDVNVKNVLGGIEFKESKYIKLLKLRSILLSNFFNSSTYIEAAVILPGSYYNDTCRYYPVVFVFPGWGATHIAPTENDFQQKRYGIKGYGDEKIFVFLNQDCRYGFHVFANSDNNGPRATSFIEEFIPYLEKMYRVAKNQNGRFLVGQSSGAWAAIWLQVNYPDMFGMTWAGSPDPLDFRDFVGHNLYKENANIFYDSNGTLTPAIKTTGKEFTNKMWSDMETALGEGGQYQSFEAVFGKCNQNNKPEQVFDRETGKIYPNALEHWKNYDISSFVRKNAEELKNKLDGKLNIVVSYNDNFYLDGSVRLFKEIFDSLRIKANIKFLKDEGHDTWNEETRIEMHGKMDSIFSGK